MKISQIFKKGIKQLQKKKEIHNLKNKLHENREKLSETYLQIGLKVSKINMPELNNYEEINSMKNVLSIIEKLEKENLELEEKIDITKEDYNHQIESYNPLIAELKENLSIPQTKLAQLKDELTEIKKSLKETKDKLKEKENIFQDTQNRINNKSEEDDLDEDKITALENDKQRLQKELLEITGEFERKTEKQNEIKENIRIVNEEIKTAQEQINNYKKEIGRLKKEKAREIEAIKKIIASNKTSLENRNKELESIYKNIGNLMFENNIKEEEFTGFYTKIKEINTEIEDINKKIQDITLKIKQTGNKVLFEFFGIITITVILIFSLLFYLLNSSDKNEKKEISINSQIHNIACNKAKIKMKIPKSLKHDFSVKSTDLYAKIKKENNILEITFSADPDSETQKEYVLHVFSSGKEFTKYKIKARKENNKCIRFYIDEN